MASQDDDGSKDQSAGAGAKAVAQDLSPKRLSGKVDETLQSRSVVSFLFDFRSVLYAVLVAIGVAALLLLVTPSVAGLVFPVVLIIAWVGFAFALSNERQPTRDANADLDDGDDDA